MSPSLRPPWPAKVQVLLALFVAAAACAPKPHLFDDPHRPPRRPDAGDPAPPGSLAPRPPALGPLALTIAGDCVRVRIEATVPVTAELTLAIDGLDAPAPRPLGTGATLFDAAFRLGGAGGAAATARVRAWPALSAEPGDGGQGDEPLLSPPQAFSTPPPGGPLVITEVLANPAGAETRQEFVEVANLGPASVDTAGLQIEDGAGADALPAAILAAGARALIVGASFVDAGGPDVPPRAGTLLLRVPGRIGKDGLGQSGEVVRLVAPGPPARVLSSYGGWVDVSRAVWSGNSIHRAPDPAACDHPQAFTSGPSPATPGW